MKHFYIKLIMAFFAMVVCIQVNAASEVTINNIKYSYNGTEATVTGYTDEPANVVIPETINVDGAIFKVTNIDSGAFGSCKSIITLEADFIEDIGHGAFSDCSNLEKVRITKCSHISYGAFAGCSKLTMVELKRAVKFEENITQVGSFYECSSLKYIVIPKGSSFYFSYGPINYGTYSTFTDCPMLQTIIYLGDNLGQRGSNANTYTASDLIKWGNNSFTYTGVAPQPSFTNQAPADFQVSDYSVSGLNKNAGSYTDSVAFTFANADMNFDVKIPYSYTIAKAQLRASVQNASRSYGDRNPQFTVNYSGFVNGESKYVLDNQGVVTTTANSASNVGTYPLTLTGASDNNYNITATNGTLTINKALLTVKADNKERAYGAYNPQLTMSYTGLKNNESQPAWITRPTISTLANETTPVGTYDITVSNGEARNYDVTFAKGTLTISKVPVRITANNQSRLYYEENPNFTCIYNGFVNGEDESVLTTKPQFTTTAVLSSKAGRYPINVSGAQAQNYSFTYASGILEVQKRSLNVTADSYTREYNQENPKFKLSYNGFVNGEDDNVLISKPYVSTTATKTSDVGTYTLVVSGGMADNYDFVYTNGQLVIEKAYQTLAWNQDLNTVPQYSQVELEAEATSGLTITYTLSNDTVCNLSYIGSKTYLDCYHYGTVVISASQEGNNNYWPTTKSYKVLTVADPTGIRNISAGKSLKGKVSVSNGRISINGLDEDTIIRVSTLSGATVYSGHNTDINVPAGVYIIRVGNSSMKVVVK